MKIILASGWYFPESLGGTEVYVSALASQLRIAGHNVFVAAPDPLSCEERYYEHDGIQVYRYPTPSYPTRAECQGACIVRGAEYFHLWMQNLRPDIVHLHTFTTGLGIFELRAAKRAGASVFVTTHLPSVGWLCQRGTMVRWGESLCDGVAEVAKCSACALHARGLPKALAILAASLPAPWSRTGRTLPGPLGTVLGMGDLIAQNQRMQRECLGLVDRFIVLTGWAKDALMQNGAPPEKIVLNRPGIDFSVEAKPGPAELPTRLPVTIGYLGRFDRIKGARELARAVSALDRSCAVRVEFRGPVRTQSDQEQLEEIVSASGDDPRVTFGPEVARAGVRKVLAGYDVLCCPSLALESGPIVAIEAHAAGTPVIGSRLGGLAETISDGVNGRLVPPGDVPALTAVLNEIARDPANTIDRWRTRLPRPRTMHDVASEYMNVYLAEKCCDQATVEGALCERPWFLARMKEIQAVIDRLYSGRCS